MPLELKRVVLIGFSGTGKSAVARALAQRLGMEAFDTDARIEAEAGRPIPRIFAEQGEPAFRALEREAVRQAAQEPMAVVATGGGAFMDAESRSLLADEGIVVALEARPETIAARTATPGSEPRPLLAGTELGAEGDEALSRIRALKAARQPFYALADLTVHTDALDIESVVAEVAAALQRQTQQILRAPGRLEAIVAGPGVGGTAPTDFGADAACLVRTAGGDYPVYVGWGLIAELPAKLAAVGSAGRLFVVADEGVEELHAATAMEALRAAGREAQLLSVPPGEASKSLDALARIYAWLAAERAERRDTVIAIGGGVVTDLAGTAAATYLRGLPLVHVPTTLLSMVDAAIGGKVAVDLPAGKNLVGAFHQPQAVVADIATLATLPERERRAGFAEVIKHAWIRDPAMLDELERDAETLLALGASEADRCRLVELIGRNVAIKAAVVSADERESDLRMILNYGHTIAHALEAVTGYGRFLHGEALGVGMLGAALIAQRVTGLDSAIVERHRRLALRYRLPLTAPGVDAAAVQQAIRSDKKVNAGAVRWVLLDAPGRPVLRSDVPPQLVAQVVDQLTRDD